MDTRSSFTVVSRIHAPEPAAASLRLAAVEKELLRRKHRVTVLTSTSPHQGQDPAGLIISRWPVLRDRAGQLRGYLPYLSFDLPLVWRVLTRPRPAAFLVEPPPTTGAVMRVLAALLRRPYVMYAPDVWSQAAKSAGASRVVVWMLRALEGFALRGAKQVIAVTEEAAVLLRQMGARSLSVVPNGVDTTLFSPGQGGPSPAELAQAGVTGPYLLYAGTASEFQGADIFARAAKGLRGCQLVFIGQGSQWPLLKELSAQLVQGPLSSASNSSGAQKTEHDGQPEYRPVIVLDQMEPAVAARWQAGASAALVSLRPEAGCDTAYPTKVLAALSSGVPVLYAGVGPARADLADPILGQVVDYDVHAVAEALRKIAASLSSNSVAKPSQSPAPNDEAAARSYRHQWVVRNRSTVAAGRRAADILEQAAGNVVPQ